MRLGDIDGDGSLDVVFFQAMDHSVRRISAGGYPHEKVVRCITAMKLDGEILWQYGAPMGFGYWKQHGIAAEVSDVDADGNPIEEMKSEPEPKELVANSSERQLPTKLAGKGVTKGASKKAAIKGNDKKRTGELEDGPEGMKHDKSKFAVKGDGPVHKAKNASFLES